MFAAVFDSVYHVDSYRLVIRSWIVSFPFVIKELYSSTHPILRFLRLSTWCSCFGGQFPLLDCGFVVPSIHLGRLVLSGENVAWLGLLASCWVLA